jgi:CDGSH-type Zn-finger protein
MSNPVVADNKPVKVTLSKGQEYHFCTCGKSNSQPFCDGSHVGSSFNPKVIVSDEDGEAYLCACKHTANAPFCDGTHKQFSDEQVGQEGPGIKKQASDSPVAVATTEEPTVEFIHQLARDGLSKFGHHGPMTSMGVPRNELPHWDDMQLMVAQMATKPLLEDVNVNSELPVFAQVKAACCQKSSKQTPVIFMSTPVRVLVLKKNCWKMCRRFTSKGGKAQKQELAVIFLVQKTLAKYLKLEAYPKVSRQSHLPHLKIFLRYLILSVLLTGLEKSPGVSLLVLSLVQTILKKTYNLHWMPVLITSY